MAHLAELPKGPSDLALKLPAGLLKLLELLGANERQGLRMERSSEIDPMYLSIRALLPLPICLEQLPRLCNGGIRTRKKLVRVVQRLWHAPKTNMD